MAILKLRLYYTVLLISQLKGILLHFKSYIFNIYRFKNDDIDIK